MNDNNLYYKYLTTSKKDIKWGMTLTVVGYSDVPSKSPYPMTKHPELYNLSWDKGRVLDEFQIIYINRGKGILELENSVTHEILAGNVFIIFPGIWHRYMPDYEIGWEEYYFGIKGPIIDNLLTQKFIQPKTPVFNLAVSVDLPSDFKRIIKISQEEHAGFQQYITSLALSIISKILMLEINLSFDNEEEILIRRAKEIISNQVFSSLNLSDVCLKLNIGYSKFRKLFKTYVGASPGQFYLDHKIKHCSDLLRYSNLTQKEIAQKLGFKNEYYFNVLFKRKTGLTPGNYRKRLHSKSSEKNKFN